MFQKLFWTFTVWNCCSSELKTFSHSRLEISKTKCLLLQFWKTQFILWKKIYLYLSCPRSRMKTIRKASLRFLIRKRWAWLGWIPALGFDCRLFDLIRQSSLFLHWFSAFCLSVVWFGNIAILKLIPCPDLKGIENKLPSFGQFWLAYLIL